MSPTRLLLVMTLLPAWAVAQLPIDPRSPINLAVGLDSAASMHGDSASTDTTPLAGPGVALIVRRSDSGALASSLTHYRWPVTPASMGGQGTISGVVRIAPR